ncbi:MAG: Lon protease family protein, partial [Methanomassiliicoccales archaeon]
GQPLSQQEFAQLSEDHRRRIQEKRQEIQSEIQGRFRKLRDLEREAGEEIRELNRKVASYALEPYLSSMKDRFSESEDVVSFLEELEKDILENLQTFMGEQQAQVQQQAQGQQISQQQLRQAMQGDPMEKYRVNLIVDNSQTEGAPVEIEWNPSYIRLLGAIEKEPRFGALVTNFSLIRAGATHRANGGFLVVPVERLLMDPILWDSLKQVISTGQLEIEEPAAKMGYMVTKTLRPEPIPFEAKVVLMGDPALYNLLYSRDRDFPELFKVKADFDTSMDRTDENIRQYASFICTLCNREELLHLDPAAIGAVIEHSSRLVEDKEKLSARFSEIADIIREANFYAVQDGSEVVGKEHIDRQLEERVYRSNLIQEKIQEMIERGSILIDTEGDKVGQVNGLAVYSSGDYVFGKPSRITASIGVGREGIVDIEREAEMGGPTHTKGVLILSGFLSQRYAGENPLSLSARLVFEQSYSGVDGDSASSTELYALLSALSGRPIRQDLAVTGSVNQKGDVQAIGGVNQKIEGFFEVCRAKGLTGDQGCVIPRSNVKNLMLKDEVLETIREGDFHIYPVDTIDEGISLLTGVEAGERREDGTYPEGSINHLVQRRLSQMADRIREFRDPYAD